MNKVIRFLKELGVLLLALVVFAIIGAFVVFYVATQVLPSLKH